ncbi:hypothetical protein [Saccharopolyspora pogona]|uniref:hypothetical protein n=1 Tax=Saccharopolyspora pogona TaxID=333966 RepID=UPI001CC230B0|nr:hypothetical protein [Saccharopolyspora pogona]
MTEQVQRHYWLPTPDPDARAFVRHAFRGRRWESQSSDTTVCGKQVAMAKPNEMDWCTAPTCLECNGILVGEQRGSPGES